MDSNPTFDIKLHSGTVILVSQVYKTIKDVF